MKTIFRKVSVKERLPEDGRLHFVQRENHGTVFGVSRCIDKRFECNNPENVEILEWQYWLEEIELPTNEEIEKQIESYSARQAYDENENNAYLCGAEWMLDFLTQTPTPTP